MDWSTLYLLIFAIIVIILSIANAVYYWRAYNNSNYGISSTTSLTLFISNIVVALIALVGAFWALYVIFSVGLNPGEEEVIEETVSNSLPLSAASAASIARCPRLPGINTVRVFPPASASVLISRST